MTDTPSALEHDAAIYKALLESTKAIPWKIDWDTKRFAYIGPQIEALLGWPQSSWVSVDDWASRIHPQDRERVVNFCVSQSQAGVDHEADYRALTRAGDYVWIRDVVHVVRNEGVVDSLVGFMFDISERKKTEEELARLHKKLEELSYTDGLTGIANRRMFDSRLALEWDDARRNRQPLSLILLDIDYFKQYNDHYGHIQGDECLREVAGSMTAAATRTKDFVARFGGEEFVLVLPETDAQAVRKVAERCRQLIFKKQIPHAKSAAGQVLTVSIGAGTIIPTAADAPLTFVEAVDRQLYKAKQGGRNRVHYA
jgi:diguanylate cyclase (GGDEF)-like protein/PAS domain S-box-containing protein